MRCFALLPMLAVTAAAAGEWVMDPSASRLEFVASYSGAELPGRFDAFRVELHFDPDRPADGTLSVVVDIASADMGDDDTNAAARGETWLDAGTFATATFTSAAIEPRDDGGFAASGTLELRGVEQATVVPFTWTDDGARASMSGELTLRRLEFGIGTGTWSATDEVADEVRVRFRVVLDRAG